MTRGVNKRNTSFYLAEETHTLIRRLAEERGTSKNHIVEVAIKALFESDREPIENEPTVEATERLEDMRDQVQFLRRELERKDTILLALTQRVPALEASSEPHRDDVTASEEVENAESTETVAEPQTAQRPWWLRILGG